MKKLAIVITSIIIITLSQNAFAYPALMGHWANIRDDSYSLISTVNEGELVEVVGVSPLYEERTEIIYNGVSGSVLTECIAESGQSIGEEYSLAEGVDQKYSEDIDIADYTEATVYFAPTGIYSKVTADLILRDRYYNPIGLVPTGAYVEVLQQSYDYPGRMVVSYNGVIGTVLSEYISPTYADTDPDPDNSENEIVFQTVTNENTFTPQLYQCNNPQLYQGWSPFR